MTYKHRDHVRRPPVLSPEWAGLPPREPGPGHSAWVSQAAPLPEPCLLTFPPSTHSRCSGFGGWRGPSLLEGFKDPAWPSQGVQAAIV